jgi:hypothetical protein
MARSRAAHLELVQAEIDFYADLANKRAAAAVGASARSFDHYQGRVVGHGDGLRLFRSLGHQDQEEDGAFKRPD